MNYYFGHIEEDTKSNENFRKVIFTGTQAQLVLMTLKPGEEIGQEVHNGVDQFFRFEDGVGMVKINGEGIPVKDGDAVIVPAGAEHNVLNTGDTPLKLYTIYSPANHPDGTIHATKAEAEAYEKEHHHE